MENSWGDKGDGKGFYVMNDSWFDEYVFEIAARAHYLPAELQRALTEGRPVEVECRSYTKAGLRWTHVYARPELDLLLDEAVGRGRIESGAPRLRRLLARAGEHGRRQDDHGAREHHAAGGPRQRQQKKQTILPCFYLFHFRYSYRLIFVNRTIRSEDQLTALFLIR